MTIRRGVITRRTIIGMAAICVLFTGVFSIQTLRRPTDAGGGMFFASVVFAQDAEEPGGADEATSTAVAADRAADGDSTGSLSIFYRDPIESLAQSLRDKQRELAAREKELKRTEERLLTLRKEIELNLADIDAKLKQMEAIAGKADKSRQTEITKWVDIYQAMPPEQAGRVFDGLEPVFALELLSKMDPKKAGKILGYIQTDKAIAFGEVLKDKRL